jgi:hypothetical protein
LEISCYWRLLFAGIKRPVRLFAGIGISEIADCVALSGGKLVCKQQVNAGADLGKSVVVAI